MTAFRSITTTNTGSTVKTTGADVYYVNVINKHNAAIFVRFYNTDVATFQDTPVFSIQVPASVGQLTSLAGKPLFGTSQGLSVRVVTDAADGGNTAAATLPVLEISYQ